MYSMRLVIEENFGVCFGIMGRRKKRHLKGEPMRKNLLRGAMIESVDQHSFNFLNSAAIYKAS